MKKISWENSKAYVIQAILLLIIGVLGWFGVRYLNNRIQAAQDRIQQVAVLSDYQHKQASRLPELQEQYDYIQSHEKDFDIMITKDTFVNFVQILEKLADETGIEIKITSHDNTVLESKPTVPVKTKAVPAQEKADGETPAVASKAKKDVSILGNVPFPDYIRLTITATGLYPQVIIFLQKVETLPVALDIIGLRIQESVSEAGLVSSGVVLNPFNPDGTPANVPLEVPRQKIKIEAEFDAVIYLKK